MRTEAKYLQYQPNFSLQCKHFENYFSGMAFYLTSLKCSA